MKTNWPTKKLGEVAVIYGGGTAPTNVPEYYQGNFNWYSPYEIPSENIISLPDSQKQISEGAQKFTTIAQPGTVLLTSRATIGNIGITSTASGYSQGIKGLTPIDDKEIDSWFLAYWLRANKQTLINNAGGTTFKEISTSAVKNLDIAIPSKESQQKIVARLDSIRKAQKLCDIQIQKTEELFESVFNNIFPNYQKGSEEKKLGEVSEIQSKLVDPRKKEFLNLIHVGAGNIMSKSEKLVNLLTSREEKLISGKFIFDPTMVLYSKIRPYLMKVVRPDFKGLCSADIYPLLPKRHYITRDYLYYLLTTSVFTEYAIKGSTRAGMPKVNREHLFAFSFFLPHLNRQKEIVENLDAIQNYKKLLLKQKELLKELFDSVLHRSMKGEMD